MRLSSHTEDSVHEASFEQSDWLEGMWLALNTLIND